MEHFPLKILVADDSAAHALLIQRVATQLGHRVVTAGDGREAVCLYQSEDPDLVIMDVVMPKMDGLAAVREIRSLPSERWVPVVFCSVLDRMEDVIRGLESGGDDYLVKPTDLRLLRAKINSYARALALERKMRAYAQELADLRLRAEEEVRLARYVMDRLTDMAGLRDPMLKTYSRPAGKFSGDLLCAARGPGEVLYLLLADATGHGLPAALTAMPLTQIFYGMTAKGFSLRFIAEELNRKLKRLLPTDYFVAATLAAIDVGNQTIEVWNGGNPDALLISEQGELVRHWRSRHPPLGILPEGRFSGETETYQLSAPADLLVCSDGLVEALSPDDEPFTLDRIVVELGRARWPERYVRLVEGLEARLAGGQPRDDVTFMLVNIPLECYRSLPSVKPGTSGNALTDWRFNLTLGAAELRYLDVVPVVLSVLSQIQVLRPHQGALFVILSELFNNALEHGLLGLDSAIKEREGGYEQYLELRAQRLQALSEGYIEIDSNLHREDGKTLLDISVKDSGQGFDYLAHLASPRDGDDRPHGRGIALVKGLCQELVYRGCGNEVRARYAL